MSQQLAFAPFEKDNRFFVKAFLLDASVNQNNWGVTEQALARDISSFIGKPFVVTNELDHPREAEQEKYRRGTIIEAGVENGKAFAVIEITDSETREQIKRGEVQFVSPSIGVEPEDAHRYGDREIITRFAGYHLAGVKEPAFGVVKAQIKGQCTGTSVTCSRHLMQVQASLSSINLPSPENLLMAEGQPIQTVDYSAQIKELSGKLDTLSQKSASLETENKSLKAQLEQEIKRPYIARILTAKTELGEIKAEETNTEADTLAKLDAGNLSTLAKQFEASAKARKEAIAVPKYRIQHSASTEAPKNGDEWLARLKRGQL